MNFGNIPAELRAIPQWVNWQYVQVPDAKPTKVPVRPHSNYGPASVNDPATWGTFEQATASADRFDGIGFVFTDNDPYCGIDLDMPPEGLSPEDGARQQLIYEKMDSYSEKSPSGSGLHIIIKGQVPHGRKRADIEVYSSGRYFTFTGNVYRNAPIADRQEMVTLLWSQMGPQAKLSYYAGDYTEKHSDLDVWNMARQAKNGDLFFRLWNGDTSGYFSASEADFALVDIIAFYTKHRMQIQRMFLSSTLGQRDKYANATPRRLSALMGYMVNKSFDRMLPPVDLSGLIDQFNAAIAVERRQGADLAVPAPVIAGAAVVADLPSPPLQTLASPHSPDNRDLWKSLHPPGLLGELVKYVYAASPRPVYEISLAASIGLMAGICGRAYNVSKTGLNHYVMLLAATGSGKEAMASGTDSLMKEVAKQVPSALDFIGPGEIASGQALLKFLATPNRVPCCVSTVGEFGLKLQQITHPSASSADIMLRSVLLDLYGKSGVGKSRKATIYSDTKNNTEIIQSPSFTLLGESTPEVFYRALDEDAVVQGLLPRFLIIEYNGIRVPLNEAHSNAYMPSSLIEGMCQLTVRSHQIQQSGTVVDIDFTNEAQDYIRQIGIEADNLINHSDRDVIRQLWNRYQLKVMKLASLLAISVNPHVPTIDRLMVEWSRSLVTMDINNLLRKFSTGEIGSSNDDAQSTLVMRRAIKHWLISDYDKVQSYAPKAAHFHDAKVVPRGYLITYLQNRRPFSKMKLGATRGTDDEIKSLEASGYIQQIPPQQTRETFKTNAKLYAIIDIDYFLGVS